MEQHSTSYIPHSFLEGIPVKLNIIKIWDESNVLATLLQEPSDNYFLEAQIVLNGHPQIPSKTTKPIRKSANHEEHLIFGTPLKELSYNSIIALTLWSTAKEYNPNSPLASTTLPLFDQNLRLREGKLNLLLWPNVAPDISFDSKTPGLVNDKNIENLNFCARKIEELEQQTNDTSQNVSLSNLRLKLFYCYKTIPSAFLEVKLPKFGHPVLFEDLEYPLKLAGLQVFGGGFNCQVETAQASQQRVQEQRLFIEQHEMADTFQVADFDFEMGRPDPTHEMFNTILRHHDHPEEVQPTKAEADSLKLQMAKPIINQTNSDILCLFYRYRYWASQYGAALPYFLNSVKWNNQSEEAEALKMMQKWDSIQIEDALYLLSSFTNANEIFIQDKKNQKPLASMIEIRKHAVKALREFSDEKIESVLLQLVSALKYEPQESTLVSLLFDRAFASKSMATYLFWYLHVESEGTSKETSWYKAIFEERQNMPLDFRKELELKNPKLWDQVCNQQNFRRKMLALSSQVKQQRGDRTSKIEFLRKKLSEADFQNPELLPQHPCCLCPDLELTGAIPEKTTIFSSAMAPIRLAFRCQHRSSSQSEFKMIFKSGDDLRQDQLVMQIFNLMNELLKGVSQDLRLLPYKILACSKSDGFLEFVPETITIQDILGKQQMSAYLKQISEDPNNLFYKEMLKDPSPDQIKQLIMEARGTKQGIHPMIMENYILSSAGYCVLTYFLGIGDRHQENLLLNNEGKMFHIDFGFILGKDPKPYPPPFKMCKEQVEGMGGMKSEFFQQFKQKCVDVYTYLRKYAKLIVYLMILMSDAGIKDYSHEAIEQMYEKFRLDDNNENAEIHFLGILEESINSMFPQMTDMIHKWASYWRK